MKKLEVGPVWTIVHDKGLLNEAKRMLRFKYQEYNPYSGMNELTKIMVTKNFFLTGLLPRFFFNCNGRLKKENMVFLRPAKKPVETELDTVSDLRSYQKTTREKALQKKRGVIISPTGSGKTIIGMSIIKSLPDQRGVFVVPTKDLFYQTYKRFVQEFGESEVGLIGDGYNEPKRITIGICKSLVNNPEYLYQLDWIVVDEAHRVSSLNGEYSKVLSYCTAPIRLGLTATAPVKPMAQWSLEGLIGPTIHEITKNELVNKGFLAKPKVEIYAVQTNPVLSSLVSYPEVYDQGIVHNDKRNQMIADLTKKFVSEGKTVLILFRIIRHGRILRFKIEQQGIRYEMAHGKTAAKERDRIKEMLETRQIPVAITSTIWKEGVDIPSLDVVINAAGAKSEIFNLQVFGRGMRTTKTKKEFTIVDFKDFSHGMLISHYRERLKIYKKEGWL